MGEQRGTDYHTVEGEPSGTTQRDQTASQPLARPVQQTATNG